MSGQFTPLLKLEIATICIVHIVAIVLSVICVGVFFLKTRRYDHAANAFIALEICIITWMVFKIFKTVSPQINLRWFSIVGYYAAICFLEVAFVEFGYAYLKRKPIPFKIKRFLYIIATIQFSWVITNPYHHLFYSYYDFWRDSFGPLFYPFMLIEYSFIGVGFYFCIKKFKREFKGKNRIVTFLVSFAIIFPLVLNFLFITKFVHKFTIFANIPVVFDITPIVFTWSTLMFMYVTFNHNFITPTPLMRHEITHNLNLAIGVFNSCMTPLYLNKAFKSLKITNDKADKISDMLSSKFSGKDFFSYEEKIENKSFFICITKVKGLFTKKYLISMKNISAYKDVEVDILDKKIALTKTNQDLKEKIDELKTLSRSSARKYVAGEIHDVIGHSMVSCVKLLEVSKIYSSIDHLIRKRSLNNAIKAVESGLLGIRSVPFNESGKTKKSGKELRDNIQAKIDTLEYTGLDIKFNFQGIIYLLDQKIFHCLEMVNTEIITNCIKHSKATRLFVAIKIKEKEVSLLGIDNGVGLGTETLKGSGLTGIEERVKSLGGHIVLSSSYDEGFMVRVLISKQ